MKKKLLPAILLVASLAFALVGCSNPTGATKPVDDGKAQFKSEIKFYGSTTLAPVLSQLSQLSQLSTNFNEHYGTWDKVDSQFEKKDIAIYVSGAGSSAGVKSVIDGVSDFGMASRKVSADEKAKIEGYQEFKLGMDALTISVNPNNNLTKLKDSLTSDEIKKIFSGEFKTWHDVDPSLPATDIVVVTRDIGGGAHEVFQKAIMGDSQIRADVIQAPSMGALVTKIMENENAIGYASYGMVNQNKGKLAPFKVDGIEPSAENILSGTYKISRPLIILKKGTLLPQEKAFMDYVVSNEGIDVIEKLGFVPNK
ncbi:phosphate ABC transporter substrate-binding protein [Desulfosporosinus shakirovi]|uniref:phosphate ABC transporter substrate-binding protein n=1 Tax=Desulfosporosinus shakirovi TaxID=2885154 RepID=UPI001E293CB2|nr:phosphate ABC transporter substrate-binding protein [Desulfosporosinus sp. SRJS8]MCB8818856.1 phosphate ABC transporter substrate-binding protein [Desulfosporosinus sp. SRJS8]